MATEEKAVKKQRKPRPRPTNAMAFTVWQENGSPIPAAAQAKIEEALQRVQFELFNDGIRLLTQTTRG